MPEASIRGLRKNQGMCFVNKIRILGSLVLLSLGAAVLLESISLGLGTWSVPGPGFLPFGAGLGLLLSSLITFLATIMKKTEGIVERENFWVSADSKRNVSLVLLSLIGYNLIWTRLGFLLSTFLLMFFLFRIVGKLKGLLSLAGAVLTSFLAYLFFGILLEGQLPGGILGF